MGVRIDEVVVNHRARQFGYSKYGFTRFLKGLLDLSTVQFLSRFGQRPLHVFGGIGLALIAVGGLGMLFMAVLWLIGDRPIGPRPFLSYSETLLGVGTQLFCLGILAELITSYNLKAKDTYSVAERLGE